MLKNIILIKLFIVFIAFKSNSQSYILTWSDEFNGTSVDVNNWTYNVGNNGWGNNELQYYTSGANSTVTNGNLEITAKAESIGGSNYSSSRMLSQNLKYFKYGKIEARIKLPQGQGIWPAFWLMPEQNIYGGWPHSGEIDIMEYLGHQGNIAHGTAHWANSAGNHTYQGNSYTLPSGNFYDDFHLFSIEWSPDEIKWFMDGIQYFSLSPTNLGSANWPYNEHYFIILNVAVGGNWPGNPDASTTFPQTMFVDYVRVYQKLEELSIFGERSVNTGDVNVNYSLPLLNNAVYNWSVPEGSTINSGQGTNEISVNWASTSGNITASINHNGQNHVANYYVDVNSVNLFENGDFEQEFTNWSFNQFNGATASTWFANSGTFLLNGQKSFCAYISNIGTAAWNLQLNQPGFLLNHGETYTIGFWAISDVNGRTIKSSVIDAAYFWLFDEHTFTLTNNWSYYTHSFTNYSLNPVLINFDIATQIGTVCFDDMSLSGNVCSPLPEITSLPNSISNQSIISLTGTPAGGIFSGIGVNGNIFNSYGLSAGSYQITYQYNDGNGCNNYTSKNILIYDENKNFILNNNKTTIEP